MAAPTDPPERWELLGGTLPYSGYLSACDRMDHHIRWQPCSRLFHEYFLCSGFLLGIVSALGLQW